VTGIKVIDLLHAVRDRRKDRLSCAGVGKTVLIQEMIYRVAKTSAACRCSPACGAPARATT